MSGGDATQEAPVIIRCRRLALGYGGRAVVRDVDLEIRAGSFVPFLGPNGAGKTTLLRGIVGLLKPLSGSIETPFRRSPPGYVPQHSQIDGLFPLTVRQVVTMGLRALLGWWGRLPDELIRKREEILELLGLLPYAEYLFRELSGGTKQKVLLARALVGSPQVIVLDEPTAELDRETEREVMELLDRLQRVEGKTILMACHGVQGLPRQAELACLVDHGQVRLVRTVSALSELEERPRRARAEGG